MARAHLRRLGMVLAGLAVGGVIAAFAIYVYYRAITDFSIAEGVLRTIDLPPEAFEVQSVEGDSIAEVTVDDVVIRSTAGDTIVAAPEADFRIRLTSLAGEGPIVLDEVRLRRPYVNLIQGRDGEVNLAQAMVVTAGGSDVGGGAEGRPIEMRDVLLTDARVRVLTPYSPDSVPGPPPEGIRLVRMGGGPMRERRARDLDARLPLVRFGGGSGWRVQVAALSATLTDPDVRVANLAGFAEGRANGAIGFGVEEFRTGSSILTAAGSVRLTDAGPVFDVDAQARPLAFADLRWIAPQLPEEGRATGSFSFTGGGGGRISVAGTGVEVTALDSRIAGFFSAEIGGRAPATFGETRVALEPLRIETLRSFGIGAELPYTGEIRGIVSSAGGTAGSAQELALDLSATVAPESGEVPASEVFAQGPVVLGAEGEIRMAGVRLSAQPLYLAALRPLVESDPERLRGALRGSVTLTGTTQDLRVEEGQLSYAVGDAPPTTLTQIAATLQMGPEPRFDISARAEPLALGTVAELFPGMPFRTARFAGPIRVTGTMDDFQLDTRLSGSAGVIAARGRVTPGTPLRFDLSGEVTAFSAEAVLTSAVPVEGPVTGTFAAAGTAEEFAFNVDLVQEGGPQEGGSFTLAGTFRGGGAAPALVQVGGDVSNFNLGALIGRPRLFPSRMSGRVDLSGGGTQPYRFDVDLRGEAGVFDVSGYYAAGDIPSYAANGTITGLNLRLLPGLQMLPPTALRGALELEGQGTTLETLAGSLRFNAVGSSVAGMRVDRLNVDVAVQDGVLVVDTLDAALAGTSIEAGGRVGLTRPVAGDPLRFRAVSRDVSRLAALTAGARGLQPRLAGSFQLQGEVTGSIRAPILTAGFQGQGLRYEAWRADRLELRADLAIAEGLSQVQGTLDVGGAGLAFPGMSIDSLRLGLSGTQDSVGVKMVLSREAGSNIELAGVMELQGRRPSGVLLDSLTLRAGELAWRLEAPATVRWSEPEGVRIANLFLRSTTDAAGSIRVDGNLPPTGNTDLEVEVRRLDLELVRRLVPNAPEIAGVVDLDVRLQGSTDDPELFAQGYGAGLEYAGVALDSLSLNAQYDERRLVTSANLWQGALLVAALQGEVPMRLSLGGAIPSFSLLRSAPLTASIRADSLPIGLLTAATTEVTDGAGTIVGQLDLSGSMDNPTLSGYANVQNGAVTAPELGRRFERISGHLILDEQQVLIDSLVVWSNGRGEVNGSIRVTDLERPELYLTASFDGFHAIDNDQIANLTMSGDVRLEGMMPEPVLSGNVRLQGGTIYIPSLNEQVPLEITNVEVGQVGPDTAVAAVVGPSALERMRIANLNVVVDEGVWLESDEANVQIQGELVVIRNGPAMQLFGTLQAVRGTYNLAIGPLVRDFEVVNGSVRFLGTPDFNPEIDITAENEVQAGTTAGGRGLAVVVHLTGTLENPSIELTSNTRPPLPESELLSYLVFGQPSFRLNQSAGALTNQLVVQELVGGLLTQQLGDLGLPCEYFRLRGRPSLFAGSGDPLGATSVECGIQLLEDVFLTVETGVLPSLTGGSGGSFLSSLLGVSLDWQVNDRVTATLAREPVQTSFGSLLLSPGEVRYQWSGDVRGTWEFGGGSTAELPVPELQNLPIESEPAVQPATPATPPPESAPPETPVPEDGPENPPAPPPPRPGERE